MKGVILFEVGDTFYLPVSASLQNLQTPHVIGKERYWELAVTSSDMGLPGQKQTVTEKKPTNNLLSITDVMKEVGMGKSWVYRKIKSGNIPSLRVGRNIKVKREDLEWWIEEQRV